jgi:hypothetical protein
MCVCFIADALAVLPCAEAEAFFKAFHVSCLFERSNVLLPVFFER